jgi:hypothetical protein
VVDSKPWLIPYIENSNTNLCISIKLINFSIYINIIEAEISVFYGEKTCLNSKKPHHLIFLDTPVSP